MASQTTPTPVRILTQAMIDRASKTPIEQVTSDEVSVLSTVVRSTFDLNSTKIYVTDDVGNKTPVNRSYGTVVCVNAGMFKAALTAELQKIDPDAQPAMFDDVVDWINNDDDGTEFLFLEIVLLSATVETYVALDKKVDVNVNGTPQTYVAGNEIVPQRVIVTLEGNKTVPITALDPDKTKIKPAYAAPQVIRTTEGLTHALVIDVLERLNGTSRSQRTDSGFIIQVSRNDFLAEWKQKPATGNTATADQENVNRDMCRVYFALPAVGEPDVHVVDVEVGLRLVHSKVPE